ncbi:MAG TPA: peptidylprolyl isomerase [Candidatus Sulfotelmatobacter sp.]|nr:peptidylprolyl isomerase [Candidatus Sulfotelmatobacter sp.]
MTLLARLLSIVTVALVLIAPASANIVEGIAAVVNDDVISAHDLDLRMRLIFSSTGQPDTPQNRARIREQVIRGLIDERIEMQEAKRLGVKVSDADMDRAYSLLEKQNHVEKGRFEQFLAAKGVSKEALDPQLRAEIAWSRILQEQEAPTIDISDEDVADAIAKLKANRDQPESLVSMIFLPVDTPDQDEPVRTSAQRIVADLHNNNNFAAAARQFSRDQTAQAGGDIGWVQAGTLPEEVDSTLAKMQPGQISDPIRSLGGYYIIQLRERRQATGFRPEDAQLTMRQIILPLAKDAPKDAVESTIALASSISESVEGCDDVGRVIKELHSNQPNEEINVRLGDMPVPVRPLVANLQVGKATQPMRNENFVRILVLCNRVDKKATIPTPEEMRQTLLNRRLEQLSRRYLRDLRRDAIVEIR